MNHAIQTTKVINDNQEITKFIIDKINNTNLSLRDIAKSIGELGLNNSLQIVKKIAKEIVFYNSETDYNERFYHFDKISDDIKQLIIHDILYTKLPLNKIAELRGVAFGTVQKISIHEIKDFKLDFVHQERFPKDITTVIGLETHKTINKLITKHFKEKFEIPYISEPKIYPNSQMGADGFLPNENQFLQNLLENLNNELNLMNELSGNFDNSLKNIKGILFDFTSNTSDSNIIDKILKYEAPELFIFIVGTQWYKYANIKELPIEHPKFNLIKYLDNVKIISHSLFKDLIKIRGKNKELFQKIINANYLQDLEELKKINTSLDINLNSTEDLRNYYIHKKFIIKKFTEYFSNLERYYKQESKPSRQEIIDKFL